MINDNNTNTSTPYHTIRTFSEIFRNSNFKKWKNEKLKIKIIKNFEEFKNDCSEIIFENPVTETIKSLLLLI